MTIALAAAANDARLAALAAHLDTGAGVARVRVYGGVRPAITDAPASALIVELPLLKPSATLDAGQLTLLPGAAQLNLISDTAVWARIVNGAGDTVLDCDVSAPDGPGELWLSAGGAAGLVLFEGGETSLASGVLG
ncbi:hypothetical protein [Acidovorax soli]|uniref:hypothetical protein n=1 Tax=Acidovorax soli TaxID=592050 RepID=UPI0032B1EC1C